jgi:hypothetical protein
MRAIARRAKPRGTDGRARAQRAIDRPCRDPAKILQPPCTAPRHCVQLGRGCSAPDVTMHSVQALNKDFQDLLQLFNRHGVRYLVVGGFAVMVHARPRYTKDLGIWLECSSDNATRVVAALDEFGFASLGLTPADFDQPDVVIQLGYEPNRVDLLTSLTGVEFATAYPQRITARIGELDLPVIDRASLVANKRALGRTKDLGDVEDLE